LTLYASFFIIVKQSWRALLPEKGEDAMMRKRENEQVMRDFGLRRVRQSLAIGLTVFLVLFLAVLYRRPGLFGGFSKEIVFAAQGVLIAAFIGFSAVNWKCPSCDKYLGGDINRRICRRCGTRLR
jgi:hypothetical protein